MKRVYICGFIFALIIAFAFWCEKYTEKSVRETTAAITRASENFRNGDLETARGEVLNASESWEKLSKKAGFMLSNLDAACDISALFSRLETLSAFESQDGFERFLEECNVAMVVLEQFASDND